MRLALVPVCWAAHLQADPIPNDGSPLAELGDAFAGIQAEIKKVGKITPQVYETVVRLRDMVRTLIEPAIESAHHVDQLLVLDVASDITSCLASYKNWEAGELGQLRTKVAEAAVEWAEAWNKADAANVAYAGCTKDRLTAVQDLLQPCCTAEHMCPLRNSSYGQFSMRECKAYPLEMGFVECDYEETSPTQCYERAHQLVAKFEGYFKTEHRRYKESIKNCEEQKFQVSQLDTTCEFAASDAVRAADLANRAGAFYNLTALELEQAPSKWVASAQGSCYHKSIQGYQEVVGTVSCAKQGGYDSTAYDTGVAGAGCVKSREVDRQREWTSTQIILCALNHLTKGGTFEDDLVKQCEQQIGICHLKISYPYPPFPPSPHDRKFDCPRSEFMHQPGTVPPASDFDGRACFEPYGCTPSSEIRCVDQGSGCDAEHDTPCETVFPSDGGTSRLDYAPRHVEEPVCRE
mmetsp:Transcript_106524/g.243915  ORF Transcript_106524/g.243915 Transcript_106524/m.243915 type:complete len:463 (-) Transcript_106524:105-1493(-)